MGDLLVGRHKGLSLNREMLEEPWSRAVPGLGQHLLDEAIMICKQNEHPLVGQQPIGYTK